MPEPPASLHSAGYPSIHPDILHTIGRLSLVKTNRVTAGLDATVALEYGFLNRRS